MTEIIKNESLYIADHGWLKSRFHFSFAEYYAPDRMQFGPLRVVNDDIVKPQTGFPTHPHRDMEIISYVINGQLTHEDTLGNRNTVGRGQVQYMSAGTGIAHSEFNFGTDDLRFLQIWIIPDRMGQKPRYGDFEFTWEDRINNLLHLVSPSHGSAPVKIYQDVNFYATLLNEKKTFNVSEARQVYCVLIEGRANINGQQLFMRDAIKVKGMGLEITPEADSHFLIIEMPIS